MSCPFCGGEGEILGNELAFARYDAFPVSPGHLLVMSRRHVADWFDLTDDEQEAIFSLIREGKALLDAEFSPDGYNIGINCKEAAGQTVFHVHVHLIPRYAGDVENPRGGVRGVIPEKRNYP
ncbi:MAG TPA: HIT family protein [Methanocorpusculum sp.]|jgi:diadenosine tetraphosphate (Ap4A) HIT family hydrolase|nr:HIT family protein [Methanocorpusculum sp.]HJJ82321.1 HIT family protein [Methanocorpusculum sp.]